MRVALAMLVVLLVVPTTVTARTLDGMPNAKQQAHRLKAEAKRRAQANMRRETQTFKRRMGRLTMPGPAQVSVSRAVPPDWSPDYSAGTIENTIYSRDPMDRFTAAHETFHVLQRAFSDADKALLAEKVGLAGREWDPTEGPSPNEFAADLYAQIILGRDPKKRWSDEGYIGKYGYTPTRRQLFDFAQAVHRLGVRYRLPQYTRPRYTG